MLNKLLLLLINYLQYFRPSLRPVLCQHFRVPNSVSACLFEAAPVALQDERDDVQNESGPYCGGGKLVGAPRTPLVRTAPGLRSTVTGKEMNTYTVRNRCSAEVVLDKFGGNRTFPLAKQKKIIHYYLLTD